MSQGLYFDPQRSLGRLTNPLSGVRGPLRLFDGTQDAGYDNHEHRIALIGSIRTLY